MADDSAPAAKNTTLRNVAFVLSGALICAAGVAAGNYLSAKKPAVTQGIPPVANEIPQSLAETSAPPAFTQEDAPKEDTDTPETAEVVEPVTVEAGMQSFAGGVESGVPARVTHTALADEELRAGSYSRAIRIYNAVLDQATGVEEASVRYRLALCAESAGHFSDARQQYQQLALKFPMLKWVSVSRLGEARCFAALGRLDGLAEGTLRQALMDQTTFSPRIRGELFHLAGRAYCQSFLESDVTAILGDNSLLMPKWVTDPNRQLDLLPMLLKQPSAPKTGVGFVVLQQTDRFPDSIFVRVGTPVSDLKLLLEAVCQRTGFAIDFSESSLLAMAGRTQQVHIEDIAFSLLLDGLCTPFGMLWWHDESGIHVRTVEEVESDVFVNYRQQLGQRLLKAALVMTPESRQAGYSRIALGALQFRDDKVVDAAYTFQMQMELEPRSEVEAEAALNLGKCKVALGQFTEARDAFLTAVDSNSHHLDARVGAYLYFSRLQIEEGLFKPAVSSLVRGLALCRGTEFEPRAAMMLASAYLMNGSPQGASSVLMQRREEFDDPGIKSAAAFLSSYARFQAAVLAAPKERAARSLVTALTRFDSETQFGAHWSYLKAQAYNDLGLNQEAGEFLLKTIQRLPQAPLRDQAMLRLANHYRFDNRLDEAAQLLAGVSGDRDAKFSRQIAMQAALVALKQGNPELAVKQCRFIVEATDDEDLQRSALKTMGQAYEMQNDHKSAVYCFAGMLPAETKPAVAAEQQPAAAISRPVNGGTQ